MGSDRATRPLEKPGLRLTAAIHLGGLAGRNSHTPGSAIRVFSLPIKVFRHASRVCSYDREAFRPSCKDFVPLAYDTTPNCKDSTPYPATPTKWTYRAIYRVGDHQVGQWSAEVSVMVGG